MKRHRPKYTRLEGANKSLLNVAAFTSLHMEVHKWLVTRLRLP